jgi:hypothetical protein
MKKNINMQKLLTYTKEELATYILKNCFLRDIEKDMKSIHIQFLLDKDAELMTKEQEEEDQLFNKFKSLPHTTFEENAKRIKAFEKYVKISEKNRIAYEKRQTEINKLLEI